MSAVPAGDGELPTRLSAADYVAAVDRCDRPGVSVTASATGALVSWSITGQANTIDHYTIFLSQDGENLMWLADLPASASSLDLAQFALNSGSYTARLLEILE